MAQYDGTIRINTKIDSGDFLKGLKKMSSQSKKLNNSISETTKEIDRLKNEIHELQTAPLESSSISRMSSECDILEKKLLDLLNQREALEMSTANSLGGLGSMAVPDQEALNALMRNNGEWKKLTADIDKTELSLEKYENKLKQAQATEQKKRDNQIERKSILLEKACNKLDVYKTKLSEINGAESGIAKKLSQISSLSKKGFSNLTKHASKSNSTLNKLSGSVTRFTKRIWGVLSSALVFSVLTKAFTALREKMAAAVKQNAQFSASMAQISGNMNNVFNNLLSAAMPALNSIMSAIAKATSYLNAFVSLLTGKTIKSSNAAADAANNQASAVGGVGEAAKKASEYLNGYDEMNVQSSKDSSGGAGGSGSSISYEDTDVSGQVSDFLDRIKKAWENADFTDFGRIVGDKINNSLENIDWTKIKDTSYKIGKSVATFINGVFETPGLFTNIGSTVAESLNTAINLALGFSENFHWDSAGQAIADSINGFFKTFDWKKSANTINSIALGVMDMIRTAIQQITWESIGADIHDFLATIKWGEILNDIGGLIVDGVCASIDFLSGLTGLPWEVTTAGIATLIGTKLGGISVGLKVGLVVSVAIAAYKIGEKLYEKLTGEDAAGGIKDLIDMDVSWYEIGQAISDGAIVDITLTPLIRLISGDDTITTDEVVNALTDLLEDSIELMKKNPIIFPIDNTIKILASSGEFVNEVKNKISDAVGKVEQISYGLGIKISTGADELKEAIDKKIDSIKAKALGIKAEISSSATELWKKFKTNWGKKTLSAKLSISTSVSSIWTKIKREWGRVAKKLKFPIQVPHFTWGTETKKILGKDVSVPKLNIAWYANGGFPDMGQLFIARERGAEMVGNIGSKTAVANNDQITTAIAAAVGPAVYDAVMTALANADLGNGDISVYVGGDKITDYVIKDIRKRTKSSGGLNPILV